MLMKIIGSIITIGSMIGLFFYGHNYLFTKLASSEEFKKITAEIRCEAQENKKEAEKGIEKVDKRVEKNELLNDLRYYDQKFESLDQRIWVIKERTKGKKVDEGTRELLEDLEKRKEKAKKKKEAIENKLEDKKK